MCNVLLPVLPDILARFHINPQTGFHREKLVVAVNLQVEFLEVGAQVPALPFQSGTVG
jgi:hypothetical protein